VRRHKTSRAPDSIINKPGFSSVVLVNYICIKMSAWMAILCVLKSLATFEVNGLRGEVAVAEGAIAAC
jgi:hypothetical protein